jgi:hypothetical protein
MIDSKDLQYLVAKIAELVKENDSLRKQLKSACNALMERKL